MTRKIAALISLVLFSTVSAALDLKGEWQQGGVIIGIVPQGTQVEYRGKQLHISPAGEFVIGLGREAEEHANIVTIDSNGVRKEHEFSVKKRTYKIQKVNGVPQRTVEPDPAQVEGPNAKRNWPPTLAEAIYRSHFSHKNLNGH